MEQRVSKPVRSVVVMVHAIKQQESANLLRVMQGITVKSVIRTVPGRVLTALVIFAPDFVTIVKTGFSAKNAARNAHNTANPARVTPVAHRVM